MSSASPYSPTKRETRIPTPSPKSSRSAGGSFSDSRRGGSASPTRRMRLPTLGKTLSGKKPTTPRSNTTPTSASRSAAATKRSPVVVRDASNISLSSPPPAGCVGAPMDLLQPGMKSGSPATPHDGDSAPRRQGGEGQPNTPWMSMINNLYQQHADEKSQWKKNLKSAKQESRQYKEELRDNLAERLRFLEAKVLTEQGTELTRTGSATTHTTQDGTTASEATMTPNRQKSSDAAQNVEVVYETMSDSTVQKKVQTLEQRLQQANLAHTFEKEHWIATLDEAAKATENGAELSKKVQVILEQVAVDWQEIHDEELFTMNQAKEHLEKRFKEMELTHQQERAQWQTEAAKLKDDSRKLLRERNEYKNRLGRHKEELEKSKATLSELERKVDLCQRQTALAQRKAVQWEEKVTTQQQDADEGQDKQRQDPPSPERPDSKTLQLRRAMQERDAALQEAEQTCKMLEDYQNRLERDRKAYNTKLKQAQEKHDKELERRMAEFKNELIEQYQDAPLSELPHVELERRYRESVEKRNELASRMRQLQEQLSSEKGNWKLKLEGSLSENRKLQKDKDNLKAQNENLRAQNENLDAQIRVLGKDQMNARSNWESRLEQASKEWVDRLSEIQQEHQLEKEELQKSMDNLREYKENAEILAGETRKQLDSLKEKHRQDVLEWKEREIRTSQKTLFEAKEDFAVELQTLHKEIARLENEKATLEHECAERASTIENTAAEWEEHAQKLQEEKGRIKAELNIANEKALEQEKRIAEWEQRVSELEKDIERLGSEAEEANAKATEMEKALDEVLDEHDEVSLAQRELVEQHESDKNEWELEREDLKAKLSNMEVRLVQIQEEASDWKQKLVKAAKERDVYRAEVEDLKELKQQNRQFQRLCDSHGAEIDVWRSKMDRLESDLTRANTLRDDERKQAVSRIESLEDENGQLRTQVDNLKSSATDSVDKEKYDSLVTEKERLLQEIEDQGKQLKDWARKVENQEDSWFGRVEQLKSELKTMEQSKDDEKEETRRVRTMLDEEREAWDRDVRALKEEREQLEYSNADLMVKLKDAEAQLKKAKKGRDSKESDREKEIIKLRKNLADLEGSITLNGRGVAEMKALHAGEIQEMKDKLESMRRECDTKLASGHANFQRELNEWKGKALSSQDEFQRQLEETRSAHEKDSRVLKEQLARADEEISSFVQQTNMLTSSLDQLQRAHDDAKNHWQNEVVRFRDENERLAGLLKAQEERHDQQTILKTHTNNLQQHQHTISSLVEGLRADVKSVKSIVQASIEHTDDTSKGALDAVHADLESIRNSLEQALSTMGDETQALLVHRDQMKALTDASARADEAHKRFFEQQERLVTEIQSLRQHVSGSAGQSDGESLVLDKVRLELVEELHRKETDLAKKIAEINILHQELTREKQMRERAEQEILTLNDQADAYGEELMRLQGVNKTLEETMNDFEDTVLKPGLEEDAVCVHGDGDDQSVDSNASSPMLDEALALAQSLTDLVHGSGSEEQETSVMAMLENISDMMDEHDRDRAKKTKKKRIVPSEVSVRSHSGRKLRAHVENYRDGHMEAALSPSDSEPVPVTSPPGRSFFGEEQPSQLSVVVNELYTRCHLLERERTQLMESTLELLQAARDANAAELQAALSTARRKSAEELLRVQEESQRGMWRMYNKLCSFCRDDVSLEEEKKEIM